MASYMAIRAAEQESTAAASARVLGELFALQGCSATVLSAQARKQQQPAKGP